MSQARHAAAPSLVGYLYQVLVALWLAYDRLYEEPDLLVSMEILDDVHFEAHGTPTELFQTKHHSEPASLTDMSRDLWKTLGIWIERAQRSADGETLTLLTTAVAPERSACRALRLGDLRDHEAAYGLLMTAAEESDNAETETQRHAFVALPREHAIALLSRVVVLDGAPQILEVRDRLKRLLRPAFNRENADTFLDYLEGWWYGKALVHLTTARAPIPAAEIEAKVNDLRQQFLVESLPIHEDILRVDENVIVDVEFYRTQVFVRQVEIAGISEPRILQAILDYYKASEQRARWLREDLLLVGQLEDYERRLVDEWNRYFLDVADEVGEDAAEAEKQQAARDVYRWAQQESPVLRIRSRCDEPFVQRGSFHMLADEMRVGWHPEFRERLAALLGAS